MGQKVQKQWKMFEIEVAEEWEKTKRKKIIIKVCEIRDY